MHVYSHVVLSSLSEGLQPVETAASHGGVVQRPMNKENAKSSRRSTARRPSQDAVKESAVLTGDATILQQGNHRYQTPPWSGIATPREEDRAQDMGDMHKNVVKDV